MAGLPLDECEYIADMRAIRGRRFGPVIGVAGWKDAPQYDHEFRVALADCTPRVISTSVEVRDAA